MENLLNSTILIVDDVMINIRLIESLLSEKGFKTQHALNGMDALEILKTTKFDLILLDILMPEMDGYTVCEKLKENPDTKEIPVIFLTAITDPESIVKGFEYGAIDYVKKPFSDLELIARVKTQLAISKAYEMQNKLINEKEQLIEQKQELIDQLEKALEEIKTLKGLIPICSYCKKIRNDEGFWDQVEVYFETHSDAKFTHSMCPECIRKHYPEVAKEMKSLEKFK